MRMTNRAPRIILQASFVPDRRLPPARLASSGVRNQIRQQNSPPTKRFVARPNEATSDLKEGSEVALLNSARRGSLAGRLR
jgi:hypothetical protein